MASSSASAVPSVGAPHSAYEAPAEVLQSLTPCEIALRDKLGEDIDRLPLAKGHSRCFHSTDMVAAFSILATGLQPSELYNMKQGRYNLTAGAFFTMVSPLAFGFPTQGWLQRLLNNNYGEKVEGDQPKNDWVRSRGEVCMMLDLPEYILKDAAGLDPAFKKEGRNVFYIDMELFELFGQTKLPPEKILFAFRTTLDEPSAEVARKLDERLAGAQEHGDAFEVEWLQKLVAAPPQQVLEEGALPEAERTERAVKKLRSFWPEEAVKRVQKVPVNRGEELDLSCQRRIGDDGSAVALLLEALGHHDSLQRLWLAHTGIGPLGAAVLAKALAQRLCSLQELQLNFNCIGDEGASKLGDALQRQSRLRSMSLDNNSIGDQGAAALGGALQRSSTLQLLSFAGNSIGDLGAAALGQALQSNSTLEELILAGNRIDRQGAVALGQALQHNSTLRLLSLGSNGIGDQGAAALGEGLRLNGTLQTLLLWRNAIGSEGATALGQVLQHNTSLQDLHLGSNLLSDADESALRAALGHHCQLKL